MSKLSIDQDLCRKCGVCIAACPQSVFLRTAPKGELPEIVREDLCFNCGHCVAVCSTDAMHHAAFTAEMTPAVEKELRPSVAQVHQLLSSRRSVRSFSTKSVPKELIEQIIEAASFAPSAHNVQSTHYLVVQDPKLQEKLVATTVGFLAKTAKQLKSPLLQKVLLLVAKDTISSVLHLLPDFVRIAEEFGRGEDTVLFNAPVTLVFHAPRDVNYVEVNANLAIQNAALMCEAVGLGAFYTGYLAQASKRTKEIATLLNIPEGHDIYGALAIGYSKEKYKRITLPRPVSVKWL